MLPESRVKNDEHIETSKSIIAPTSTATPLTPKSPEVNSATEALKSPQANENIGQTVSGPQMPTLSNTPSCTEDFSRLLLQFSTLVRKETLIELKIDEKKQYQTRQQTTLDKLKASRPSPSVMEPLIEGVAHAKRAVEALQRERDGYSSEIKATALELSRPLGIVNTVASTEEVEQLKEQVKEQLGAQTQNSSEAISNVNKQNSSLLENMAQFRSDLVRHRGDVDDKMATKAKEMQDLQEMVGQLENIKAKDLKEHTADLQKDIENLNERVNYLLSDQAESQATNKGHLEYLTEQLAAMKCSNDEAKDAVTKSGDVEIHQKIKDLNTKIDLLGQWVKEDVLEEIDNFVNKRDLYDRIEKQETEVSQLKDKHIEASQHLKSVQEDHEQTRTSVSDIKQSSTSANVEFAELKKRHGWLCTQVEKDLRSVAETCSGHGKQTHALSHFSNSLSTRLEQLEKMSVAMRAEIANLKTTTEVERSQSLKLKTMFEKEIADPKKVADGEKARNDKLLEHVAILDKSLHNANVQNDRLEDHVKTLEKAFEDEKAENTRSKAAYESEILNVRHSITQLISENMKIRERITRQKDSHKSIKHLQAKKAFSASSPDKPIKISDSDSDEPATKTKSVASNSTSDPTKRENQDGDKNSRKRPRTAR